MILSLRYLKGGHIWNTVAAALNQGSTLIANVLVANLFTSDDFGRYGVIQISVTAIAAATQLSAWLSAAHFCGRFRDSAPDRLGSILFVIRALVVAATGCATLLLIVLRDVYAENLLDDARLGFEVAVAAIYVLFAGWNSYQIGVLVGLDSLRGYATSSVVQGLISIGAIVGGSYFGGLPGALFGLSMAAVVRWALTAVLVKGALAHSGLRLRREGLAAAVPMVARFSVSASLNGFTYMASLWLTATLIVRQPDGLLMSALYAACMNIKTLVLFAPQQANAASVSYLSRYRADLPHEYRGALASNLLMVTLVAFCGAGIVAIFARQVLGVYGDEFESGVPLLEVMMVAAVVEAIGYGLTQHFSSRAAMWTVFLAASLPRDLTICIGVYSFLPTYGLELVAWVFTVAWLVYGAGLAIAIVWRRGRARDSD